MEYKFTTGAPITEQEALKQVEAMGFHGLAFDDVHAQDETLHWHEFDAVVWVISGTGAFADEHGNVTRVEPGCRGRTPAGWLHRSLAGTQTRTVIGTNLPADVWTTPLNKDCVAQRRSPLEMGRRQRATDGDDRSICIRTLATNVVIVDVKADVPAHFQTAERPVHRPRHAAGEET